MLISKVPDEDGGKGEGREPPVIDNSHEYQTASELFDLMAKNQNFNTNDGDTLTPSDLVLLYKNIDLGTKLMSSAKELKHVKPNQHVETIIYNDDPESDCSDISEIYSNEDLQNVYLVNNERIDLLNNQLSVENTLCPKLGDFEIQTSGSNEYNKHFVFKDPYIKEQLKNFNLLSSGNEINGTVLPATLLDYVCCKRLEDNYNFYMDNIIRYVKNTIEQLKRISNGDYLTDKAKEKWREVEHVEDAPHNNTKVLATSTSIPLHVECKVGGLKSMWDDIVHSAVDVRSLSKILEKKIVVEIPKLINGSYTLLSKCCADNLIISCKKDNKAVDECQKESRVDVVFQLKRSETGHVISNISSIMILQNAPITQAVKGKVDPQPTSAPLPLTFKEIDDETCHENVTITELDTSENLEVRETCIDDEDSDNICCDEVFSDSSECLPKKVHRNVAFKISDIEGGMNESSDNRIDGVEYTQKEASFEVCPDDLRVTIQRLAIQSALLEENVEDMSQSTTMKKKSPTRVRIKSPYENQSHVIEEKKRRKLLEIRERRERKKLALTENCKISKHKYGKGASIPQASSSVTKLSITNKSFYNSIYGQSANMDSKQTKNRNAKGIKKDGIDLGLENLGSEQETPTLSPEKNPKKFINRSYYLDDTVTEMMYMNMKQEKENEKGMCSASTSGVSNDFNNNLHILSELISPCDFELSGAGDDTNENLPDETSNQLTEPSDSESNQATTSEVLTASRSTVNIVPLNSPKGLAKTDTDKGEVKKIASSVECRKSIDKIYQLMKKMGKKDESDSKQIKTQDSFSANISNRTDITITGKESSSIQGSDSGTSLKHQLTSSNPSTFSFDKNNNIEVVNNSNKNSITPTNVVPKVIISSKCHIPNPKIESERNKKDPPKRRMVSSPTTKVPENNPLKAISQLLHEFENVQRNRLKSATEQKSIKKSETTAVTDGKTNSRLPPYRRRSRFEQHNDTMDRPVRVTTPKDKKSRQILGVDIPKIPYQQTPDERFGDKNGKKKITDMLDEVKEARGEAVRGPSKFNSRLNSLAQPKRSYVQAHSEEYQTRYGRNLITDRLQRLAAVPTTADRVTANSRNKMKRNSHVAVSAVSLKLPLQTGHQIERSTKPRRSSNSSPEARDRLPTGVGPSYKQTNVPETPEILKKKMVAVESYVKNHYGRASSSGLSNESQIPQKSRAPLLPSDIDMASVSSSPSPRESTEAGSKLHSIIDSMIKTSHGLEVLTECLETNSRSSKEITDDLSLVENLLRCDEEISIDSDYTTGTTDDGIALASTDHQTPVEEATFKKYDVQPFKSATELEKINHALCRPLSVGTFTKRLRINNLTLTPKPSIQQLFLLQSGDTGSLVVKASISQNIPTEKLKDLKTMPILSKTHVDWSFTNIPMQIATVGYAFPEYKSNRCGSPSLCQLLADVSKNSANKSPLVYKSSVEKSSTLNDSSVDKSHKDCQCYKGGQVQLRIEKAEVDSQSQTAPISELSSNANVVPPGTSDFNNEDTKHLISEHDVVDGDEKSKTIHRTQTIILQEKDKNGFVSNNPEGVDYTTSLDILVGLLNEIQKITTCQTHITNNEPQECKELEMILNKTALRENSVESSPYNEVSITSLEKLRCLESSQSIYSFYLSDNDGLERAGKMRVKPEIWCETKNSHFHKPIYADKEVNVDIADKERVNALTDVPSVFFPITLNHSTNVTSSVLGELCQSSTQSLYSFTDYNSTYSNESTYSDASSKKIIELPHKINVKDLKIELPQVLSKITKINEISQIRNTKGSNEGVACYEGDQDVKKSNEGKPTKHTTKSCEKTAIIKKNEYIKNCLKGSDFDPVMKLKRDILVTVYSMLVLTVFAALSFPDVLYHI